MKKLFTFLFAVALVVVAWGQPVKKVVGNPGNTNQDQVKPASAVALDVSRRPVYQYAVKVVQGEVNKETKPVTIGWGNYFTKVNVHNPWNYPVKFWVKLVLSGPDGKQGPAPSPFFTFSLDPDYATEFSQEAFQMIFKELPRVFEGFLVIITRHPLDVVGVYTGSSDPAHLATMYMERVPAREMNIKEVPVGLKMEE
ncbi:MAG TPA: hypothetical protein PKJ24_03925 [Prolixibacteraceae bacterium]|nr:hypothetical protein [Prolixibacteraceae bacterium]HPT32856.1 hypothetical protein [Prolixibacteraceae bacterium]